MLPAALLSVVLAAPVPKDQDKLRNEALAALLGWVESEDLRTRVLAVRWLGPLGHPGAVPHLRKLLTDAEPRVRLGAVSSLAHLSAADKDTVAVFRDTAAVVNKPGGNDSDRLAVEYVWMDIAGLGERATPFLPHLRAVLKTTPPKELSSHFGYALAALPRRAPDMAGELLAVLDAVDPNRHFEAHIAGAALRGLADIATTDAKTVAALERLIRDKHERDGLAGRAARLLLRLDPRHAAARDYLLDAGRRPDSSDVPPADLIPLNANGQFTKTILACATDRRLPLPYRSEALRAIQSAPKQFPTGAEVLAPLLADDDTAIRMGAMLAILRLDPTRREKLHPQLLDLISRQKLPPQSRGLALAFLREDNQITPAIRETLRALFGRAERVDYPAGDAATTLLLLTASDPDPAAVRWFEQRLDRWASDREAFSPDEADYAFRHLSELGPAGKRFAPQLVAILRGRKASLDNFYLVPALRELTR